MLYIYMTFAEAGLIQLAHNSNSKFKSLTMQFDMVEINNRQDSNIYKSLFS